MTWRQRKQLTVSTNQPATRKAPPDTQGHLPNCILTFLHPCNRAALLDVTRGSLAHLQGTFFKEGASPVAALEARLAGLSHTEALHMFFLLLNVDAWLKKQVFDMDRRGNHAKLSRFLVDLRELTTQYLIDTRKTATQFVEGCIEAYILA